VGEHEKRGSEQRRAANGGGARTGAEPLQLVISRSPTSVEVVVTRAAAAEATCGGERRPALLAAAAAFVTPIATYVKRVWRATATPATARVLYVASLPPATNRGLGVVPAATAITASPQPGPAGQGEQTRGRGARRGARRRGAARALARPRAIARARQLEGPIHAASQVVAGSSRSPDTRTALGSNSRTPWRPVMLRNTYRRARHGHTCRHVRRGGGSRARASGRAKNLSATSTRTAAAAATRIP
jgi:hypothetical protein